MAKGKAKKKAKVKTKAKAKPKVKAKAKPKAKVKAKAKPKAKAKGRDNGPPPPPSVTPGMCNSFTAQTGAGVIWQNVPVDGCYVSQIPGTTWPFVPPTRFFVAHLNPSQTPNTYVNAGPGQYRINVECCTTEMPKNVTVP